MALACIQNDNGIEYSLKVIIYDRITPHQFLALQFKQNYTKLLENCSTQLSSATFSFTPNNRGIHHFSKLFCITYSVANLTMSSILTQHTVIRIISIFIILSHTKSYLEVLSRKSTQYSSAIESTKSVSQILKVKKNVRTLNEYRTYTHQSYCHLLTAVKNFQHYYYTVCY